MKLFNYQLVFYKINVSDIIFLDKLYYELNLKNYTCYYLEKNQVNLFYLYKTILNFLLKKNCKTLKLAYFYTLIIETKCKIVIDNIESDRGRIFKKLLPSLKLILYQHGIDFSSNNLNHLLKFTKPDYFLALGKNSIDNSNIRIEEIKTGSLRNNLRNYTERKKIYDIMIISEFRSISQNFSKILKKNFIYYDASESLSNSYMIKILEIINRYSKKNKKIVSVAFASNRIDKKVKINKKDEFSFFKKYLPQFKTENIDNETLAEKSKLVICMTSNFGQELAIKGHKVLFLNFNYNFFNLDFNSKKLNGIFWQKEINEEKVIQKILYLSKINYNTYRNLIKKYLQLIIFDYKNLKFHSLLKKILNY